jgi:hypothetical protein
MKIPSKKRLCRVVIEMQNGMTRTIQVAASSREVAERRALKRNPSAIGIKRSV